MMKTTRFHLATLLLALLTLFVVNSQLRAAYYILGAEWSDAANPNGVWSYREGTNALPHVSSWQEVLGGWNVDQPGWAKSEDGNNRLPFWFKSNGSENFGVDWLTGDVVIHSTDPINGAGSGDGNVLWTSPENGLANIAGSVWIGRDIGRTVDWSILLNGTPITGGTLTDGDPYDRMSPFTFASGSGGPSATSNLPVSIGDTIELRFSTIGIAGDFVGVNLAVDVIVPEPATMMLAGLVIAELITKRRYSPAK